MYYTLYIMIMVRVLDWVVLFLRLIVRLIFCMCGLTLDRRDRSSSRPT